MSTHSDRSARGSRQHPGGVARWSGAGAGCVRQDQGHVVQGGFTGGLVHGPLGHCVGQGLVAHDAGVGLPSAPVLLTHGQDAVDEVGVRGLGLGHRGTGHIRVRGQRLPPLHPLHKHISG